MPDPYANLFDENAEPNDPPPPPINLDDPRFDPGSMVDPLEAVLEKITAFKQKGEQFSAFLSQTRAVDHRDEADSANGLLALFFNTGGSHSEGNLRAERHHYELLQKKFHDIISQMKGLATEHWEIVKQFNADIDKHYFSMTKDQRQVKTDIENTVDSINLQRRILSDAARDLEILEGAMKATERRLKDYVDAGGINNLSASEHLVLTQNRQQLTNGAEYQFNYAFFDMNMLDKLAIQFGIYLKETTAQYFQKLSSALDAK